MMRGGGGQLSGMATGGAAASTPWGAITYAVIRGAEEAKRIVVKAIDAIKSAITSLADQFNKIKSVILDTVQAFQPFTVVMFNRAMLDLKATMGQIFLPILKQMISIVRAVADAIYNLPQGFKDAIRAITSIILSISGFTAAVVGIIGVIAAVVTGVIGFVGGLVALAGIFVALSPLLLVLAGILAPFVIIVGALSAALVVVVVGIVQFIRMLLNTSGGMNLLNNLMRGFYQIINAVGAGFSAMMAIISPIIDLLMDALSQLGDALSELFDAIKPILAGGLILALAPLVAALVAFAAVATAVAKVLTLVSKLVMALPMMGTLKLLGQGMPEVSNKKSAYGLGWSHAEVGTDANALYNKITEELLRNTRMGGGEAQKDPNVKVAENTTKFADLLVKALNKYLVQEGPIGMALKPFAIFE